MQTIDKVKELVATQFKIDLKKIDLQTNFFSELGADSLEMLSFVTTLEKEYSVVIGGEELDKLYCVENIVNFLTANNAKVS